MVTHFLVLKCECKVDFLYLDMARHGNCLFYFVLVLILSAISPCTAALKALYNPSHCTSTAQLSNY